MSPRNLSPADAELEAEERKYGYDDANDWQAGQDRYEQEIDGWGPVT